jgi:hypothetical protein
MERVRERSAMVYSSVGYCPCGAEIWIEYLHTAGRWQVRFLDDSDQAIETCPHCRRRIMEEELVSR